MTVFVDTGVFYADHDTDTTRHDTTSDALDALYDAEYGHIYGSDYVYDEAVTLTLRRSGSHDAAERLGEQLRGADPYPSVYELLRASTVAFFDAVEVFERYEDQQLSFTDATTVALCRRHGTDHVLSFDDDFDGVVPRLDPADA